MHVRFPQKPRSTSELNSMGMPEKVMSLAFPFHKEDVLGSQDVKETPIRACAAIPLCRRTFLAPYQTTSCSQRSRNSRFAPCIPIYLPLSFHPRPYRKLDPCSLEHSSLFLVKTSP